MYMEKEAEVLGTALELERKGFLFYKKAERETENETGKKMFAQLAKEEEEHLDRLKTMFTNLYPQKTHKEIPLFDTDVSEYAGEVEAVKIAIEMEEKSIEFYRKWAKGNLQSLFKELIEFEKGHLELLQAELDYLVRTGFWFDYFESSLED
jgi:rubrerythrin